MCFGASRRLLHLTGTASIGWRCRFSSCYRYKTVTVTSWAKSTPRSWAAFIWGWVCFKCVCTAGKREGRGVSISYFAGLHSTCLSISSLSCQRRHVFGLSKHYGVGVWLFYKKGGKNPFLTLAVSRMCNLRENETMSKVMPKAGAGRCGGSLSLALPGAGIPPGTGRQQWLLPTSSWGQVMTLMVRQTRQRF